MDNSAGSVEPTVSVCSTKESSEQWSRYQSSQCEWRSTLLDQSSNGTIAMGSSVGFYSLFDGFSRLVVSPIVSPSLLEGHSICSVNCF